MAEAEGHQGHVPPNQLEVGAVPPFQSHAYQYCIMVQCLNFMNKYVYLLLISTLISTTNSGPINCRSMGSATVKLIGKWVRS